MDPDGVRVLEDGDLDLELYREVVPLVFDMLGGESEEKWPEVDDPAEGLPVGLIRLCAGGVLPRLYSPVRFGP